METRQRARTDLLWLCYFVLGYKDVREVIHGKIIQNLQQFKGGTDRVEDRSDGKIQLVRGFYKPFVDMWDLEGPRERLTLIPRNHLKTTVCTIAHTIQWLINYPDVRILLSSGTGGQVAGFLKAIKEHFQTNEVFRSLFPEFCPQKNVRDFGNQEQFTVPCRTIIRPEPSVATTSVGSVVAGAHYDVIKHDDMVDKENIRTPEQIQNVKNHYGFLDPLLQRVNKAPHRGWTDVIGTRYDYSDLYGALLDADQKKKEEGRADWGVLVQSAILEGDLSEPETCKTLWPKRFDAYELIRIAEDPTRGWPHLYSQYLMDPRPDSSGLVDNEDQIVWVPQKDIKGIYAYLSLHVTVDLAGMEPSTNKLADNDYTVINVHGFGHDGTLFILNILRGRYTPFEVIDLLFKTSAIHPRLMDIKVEKEAHARVLLPFLKREMAKRGKWLPIVEIRRDNRTSKQQRIKGLQPWFRNGSIKFADSQPHKLAIINEIMRFPKYAHDDILDTIADAMQGRDGAVQSDIIPMGKPDASTSMLDGKMDGDLLYWRPAQLEAPNPWEAKKEEEYVGYDPLTGF